MTTLTAATCTAVNHPSHDGIHATTPECALPAHVLAAAWSDAQVTVVGLTSEEKIANARREEARSRAIRALAWI